MAKGSGGGGRGGGGSFSRAEGIFRSAPNGWNQFVTTNYDNRNKIWRTTNDGRDRVVITYSKRKNDFHVAKLIGSSAFYERRLTNLRSAIRYGESL